MTNHQREGAKSNTHVGKNFEESIRKCFEGMYNVKLEKKYKLKIGITKKKDHAFDFGHTGCRLIIECKAHTWTKGDNVPSAKMTTWNEAMYYFYLVPSTYRKAFVVQRDVKPSGSKNKRETLAKYYIRTYGHMIPSDVDIYEFDTKTRRLTLMSKQLGKSI